MKAVYFIRAGQGPVKIGSTSDPVRRIAALQVSNHEPLSLLGFSFGIDEREVQERFKGSRLAGEWFAATAELLDFVSALPKAALVPSENNGKFVRFGEAILAELRQNASREGRNVQGQIIVYVLQGLARDRDKLKAAS